MENDEPKMKNEKKKKEINSCGFMKLAKNPCGEREREKIMMILKCFCAYDDKNK